MKVFEEGAFHGVRVMIPCSLGTPDGYCFVDTAGSVSILKQAPTNGFLISKGKIEGLGWSMDCSTVGLLTLELASRHFSFFEASHCPEFTEFFSPSIGMNAFWGSRFTMDFGRNEFTWDDTPLGANSFPVEPGGRSLKWILMDASFEGLSLKLAWDTGAPITLVTPEFVASRPGAFEEEHALPLPGSVRRAGGRAYRIKAPIVVNGVALNGLYVHAVDLKKFFGESVADLPVILGTDHLRRARWSFDLASNRARVEPLAELGPVALER